MKKAGMIALAAAAALTLLAGCTAAAEPQEIDLTTFTNADGAYVFHGLDWLCSAEEVEKAQGVSFAEAATLTSLSGLEKFTIKSGALLDGNPAAVTYEFRDGLFNSASYMVQTPAGEMRATYDALFERLTGIYGEPEAAEETEDGPRCRWLHEADGTMTFLSLLALEGAQQPLTLAVYIIVPEA